MDSLLQGIGRFRRRHYHERSELFQKLARGQSPRALFVTCSDSRIAPHLVTGAEPGDLFVIRNAGNLVPPYGAAASGEEAAVEYAVSVLGVRNIIVCGHSDCGAMKGLLDPSSVAHVPSVARWLQAARSTKAVVDATVPESASAEQRLARAIEINALRQLDNLRGHPSVAAALARNEVELHAWVYDIGGGSIVSYDHEQRRYVELLDELHAVGYPLSLVGRG